MNHWKMETLSVCDNQNYQESIIKDFVWFKSLSERIRFVSFCRAL